ncbi:MAG: hypothetical protein ABI207_04995 [Crocinitomicaceae bacterium]
MSTHTLTYSMLPSMDELMQFKQGTLHKKRVQEIEQLIQTNPMVAEALLIVDDVSASEVIALTNSLRGNLASYLIAKSTFWWKFIGWTSSIAVIAIIGWLFLKNNTNPSKLISKTTPSTQLSQPTVQHENTTVVSPIQKNDTKEQVESNLVVAKNELKQEKIASKDEIKITESNLKVTDKTKAVTPLKNEGEKTVSTPTKQAQNAEKSSPTSIMLNLQYVQILQKTNPNDSKVKTKSSSQYDPLGRGTVKKTEKTYAAEDLPSFPGGDDAIQDYFRGIIHPVSIPIASATTKNRSCYVRILVNARGKVKETEIIGTPPAEIKEQLKKGLEKLPDFIPGKGNEVEYLISLSY